MKVYAGIDLHSSNNYLGIIDEKCEKWVESTFDRCQLFSRKHTMSRPLRE